MKKIKFLLIALSTSFVVVAQQSKITKPKLNFNSYDYSKIAEHPRLLLNKNEEVAVINAINKSPELKKVHEYIIETSNKILTKPLLERKKRGKRLLAVSREALTRLYYLSYSYRLTRQPKYLKKAEEELNNLSHFVDWNPEHFLDIGEMTMAVAIGYDWLHHKLQDSTKVNVRTAIKEKAFKPSYVDKYNWFLRRHSNWNSVCNAGLLYGALAILEDEKEASIPIIERAMETIKQPLEVFGPDGNYPEGPGYWNYGATFQVMFSAALESALGSDKDLHKAPGFMNSANYMLFAAGSSGDYFNYYDCGRKVDAASSLFWFAKKTNNPSLVVNELKLINDGEYTKAVSSDIHRIVPNTIIFAKDLDLSNLKKPEKNIFVGKGKTPVALVMTDWDGKNNKYFGIKAGSASDGHSHMDQGAFVYDIGNLRWAMDFGMQSYRSLEKEGVDLWNLKQDAQRWDVFRYNNFNHNTLSINNLKHNVKGRAKIIESFDNDDELGAKIDLTEVLNHNNELKSATRKAIVFKNKELIILDEIETNDKAVNLRWNMVTPSEAEIVDDNTIKLTQKSKVLFLNFKSDNSFKLVLRPSENPSEYKTPYSNKKYGYYNQKNVGTIMVGFDAVVPANTKTNFIVTLIEGKPDLALKENTIILDAPSPSKASEGNTFYADSSPIGVSYDGFVFAKSTPDWIPYGKLTKKRAFDKAFKFNISAKRITDKGLVNAGIDRANNGQLGIRGGDGNGIDKNEGYLLGLDISEFDENTVFKLTKIGFTYLDNSESCVIVNKQNLKMMNYDASKKNLKRRIKVTSKLSRTFVDVTELDIELKGGKEYVDFLSIFNTSNSGSYRISGFEFVVK